MFYGFVIFTTANKTKIKAYLIEFPNAQSLIQHVCFEFLESDFTFVVGVKCVEEILQIIIL